MHASVCEEQQPREEEGGTVGGWRDGGFRGTHTHLRHALKTKQLTLRAEVMNPCTDVDTHTHTQTHRHTHTHTVHIFWHSMLGASLDICGGGSGSLKVKTQGLKQRVLWLTLRPWRTAPVKAALCCAFPAQYLCAMNCLVLPEWSHAWIVAI